MTVVVELVARREFLWDIYPPSQPIDAAVSERVPCPAKWWRFHRDSATQLIAGRGCVLPGRLLLMLHRNAMGEVVVMGRAGQ